MSVCGVQYDYVHLGIYQGCNSFQHVCGNADCGTAEKSALCILCCQRIFDGLFNILDGDKTLQIVIGVNNGKLFLSCLGENLFCLFQSDSFRSRNQTFAGHRLFDFLGEICFKFQIAVGNDTN